MITALDVCVYKNFNFDNTNVFYNFYIDNYDYLDMQDFFNYIADNNVEEINYPKIYAIKNSQKKKEYEVVLTFFNKNNNKNYVIFTDNISDNYGKIRLLSAIYDLDNPNLYVGNLSSKEEWSTIYKLINSIFLIKK